MRLWIALMCLVGWTAVASAEPRIQWTSDDVVVSKMTVYKYHFGPPYEKPSDPKARDPGSNYGLTTLTVSDEPPRVMDRLLKRDGRLSGTIADPPAAAKGGRAWIEDNYGRVLDEFRLNPALPGNPLLPEGARGPSFDFKLSVARAMHIGVHLKVELTDGRETLWTGTEAIRLLPPAADPWGDFLLGAYNMGTKPGTGELWRKLGLNHRAVQTTNSPVFAAQNDLRFHASNIVYSLLGLYHRDYKRWWEIQAAEAANHGPITLARHRCLSDPKEEKFITDILAAAAMRFAPYEPLHYSIGDEIGIGDMASPHDLCGSKWCLAGYRKWLAGRYGDIDKLNAQWGTRYRSFDEAEMFSTWQAMERAKTDWNFSGWADRLEFMDKVLYDAIAVGVAAVRKIDPDAVCNVSGVQQPSCWQFDHWRLANTVNCATPYEIGEGPDVLMSFYDDGKKGKLHSPGFGSDTEGLWRAFIRGYHLSAQWDSWPDKYSILIDIDKGKLTPLGEKVKAFADWVHAGPGRLRERSERRRDPVAILYSQPSLRGNWILEMTARPDVTDGGEKWITRGSWSVRKKEKSFRVRVSWVQWTHDVGIWPKFVDVSQVDEGYLETNGFKVLILPRAVALSDATAAAIRKFAEGGGTVIADTWCGLMDEHCRMRGDNKGVLDELFGVKRGDWKALDLTMIAPGASGITVGEWKLPFVAFEKTLKAEGGSSGAKAPNGAGVVITRSVGKGKAVYLNFDMESYLLHRISPGMVDDARRMLLLDFYNAGVLSRFSTVPPGKTVLVGHDVCVYANGRGYLVGVMQNPTVMHSEVGGVETRYAEIKDNVFAKPCKAYLVRGTRAESPEPGMFAYDLTDGGKSLGQRNIPTFTSEPKSGRVFAFWPFEITGVDASAEVTGERKLKLAGKLVTSEPVKDEKLVVALRVLDADGAERPAYTRTIDVDGGKFALELPLGLNEHGPHTVVVKEPCSGLVKRVNVSLP